MPAGGQGSGLRPRAPRDPGVVEPLGYAVTQFLAAIGFVAGLGLAPVGLLLFMAAMLLSVIDLRRLRAANPGLLPETAEAFEAPAGKILLRYSSFGTGLLVGLSILGFILVAHENDRAASIGPALIGGVVTLVLNWRLKLALAGVPARGVGAAGGPGAAPSWRPGDPDPDDDPPEQDDR